jgi:hypothetical protein
LYDLFLLRIKGSERSTNCHNRTERNMTSHSTPVEYFLLLDADGSRWNAPRQPIGGGLFRMPDDPTTRAQPINISSDAMGC